MTDAQLAEKMIEVADHLGERGYESLAENIRYAAETISGS